MSPHARARWSPGWVSLASVITASRPAVPACAHAGAPWRWEERMLIVSRDVRGVVDSGSGAWDLAATSLAADDAED